MSPVVRRLGPDDWRLWRDLRLAALADAPDAFASSLAREQNRTEADWRAWLEPARGLKAVANDRAGLIGAWQPETRPGAVELYSMWVHPDWRGKAVSDSLIEEVLAWAIEHAHPRVDLWVAEGNERAERLYERHGFRLTDESSPPSPASPPRRAAFGFAALIVRAPAHRGRP